MAKHTPRSRLLRNARVLRRTDQIIDAAAHVFAQCGYHGTSTQAIADVLGLRQASLYYYFTSKEAALEIVCEKGVHGFLERAQEIAAGDAAPLSKVALLIKSHLHPINDKPDYVRVFINERRYLPEAARKRIARKSRAIEKCFHDALAAGVADGSIASDIDVRFTVLNLLGMCNSVINWPAKDLAWLERAAEEIARFSLGGLQRR